MDQHGNDGEGDVCGWIEENDHHHRSFLNRWRCHISRWKITRSPKVRRRRRRYDSGGGEKEMMMVVVVVHRIR